LAACKKRVNEATGLYDYAVWAMNGGKFWGYAGWRRANGMCILQYRGCGEV
jgi:hypothetical protein